VKYVIRGFRCELGNLFFERWTASESNWKLRGCQIQLRTASSIFMSRNCRYICDWNRVTLCSWKWCLIGCVWRYGHIRIRHHWKHWKCWHEWNLLLKLCSNILLTNFLLLCTPVRKFNHQWFYSFLGGIIGVRQRMAIELFNYLFALNCICHVYYTIILCGTQLC
jgi:hypothetical protein